VTLTLQTRLGDLVTAVATDIKQHRTWITGTSSGDINGLNTTNKTSLVAAINEVLAGAGGGDVTQQDLDDLKAEILGVDVPAALDTLDELAAALADDANFAASVTAELASKQDAADIGNTDTDLLALYVAAKA
jgi:hypothetical protein